MVSLPEFGAAVETKALELARDEEAGWGSVLGALLPRDLTAREQALLDDADDPARRVEEAFRAGDINGETRTPQRAATPPLKKRTHTHARHKLPLQG